MLDGDGKKDILTGNTDGQILFYKNIGTDYSSPVCGAIPWSNPAAQPIDLAGSSAFAALCLLLDRHGKDPNGWDLLVGYGDGKIRLYRGLPRAGDFNGNGDSRRATTSPSWPRPSTSPCRRRVRPAT